MTQAIRIRGCRTHNLRDVDLDLPRGRVVVLAGVSGSGKSSLVLDTVAAEAGHQLNETFPPFARNRLPRWTRPEVDEIDGLSPVVVVDQRRLGGNARSTVGTVTDAWTYLRLLFSRLSTPHVGESVRFSFNDPRGMCPRCSGLGEIVVTAVDRFLDLDRSLEDGAIRVPGFGYGGWWYRQYADIGAFDPTTPLREWSPVQREALLYGGEAAARLGGRPPEEYEGLVERFERVYLRSSDDVSERKRATIERFTRSQTCPECGGDRLAEAPRTATVLGRTIGELARTEVADLLRLLDEVTAPQVAPVVRGLRDRLQAMVTVGLGYLSLGRPTATLSGGESQRVKTVRHLGSSLTEMLYVFDEPTVGLHPQDTGAMVELLTRLRDKGNTVLVVEHDPDVMAMADQVVEIGPGAGSDGGRLTFQGTFAELVTSDTVTGRAIRARRPLRTTPRPARGAMTVARARRNNLRNVTVDVPRGVLTVLTGVAGSGKSSLAAELVAQHGAVVVDQRPVTTNRRSTPVTWAGIAPAIRATFARHNGVPAALFSANSEGGCPACKGLGVVRTDLAFLEAQESVCETCEGRRYRPEVLEHTVAGLTIADIDRLTVDDAIERFPSPAVRRDLRGIADVGLGYLRLGQSLTTLSGGECQRLKIARELLQAQGPATYVLDEPTSGLHLSDVETLLGVLDRLTDAGHTVVVIEHSLDVIGQADWVIDMGPGPGHHGGTVVYTGTVAGLLHAATPTGAALRRHRSVVDDPGAVR